jgi:hypothetical protein
MHQVIFFTFYLVSKYFFENRFLPRDGDYDYLDIIPGNGGCYAQIPFRPGRGRMEVKLALLNVLHHLHRFSKLDRPSPK